MSNPINTSICKAIISPQSRGIVDPVLFDGGLYGRVAYFDGSVSLKTVKLDPSTDNSIQFSFFVENIASGPVIVSDRSTEYMFGLTTISDGRLVFTTSDSVGTKSLAIGSAGTIVNNTKYTLVANYTLSTKTWAFTLNGSALTSRTHDGTFTLGNIGEITLGDAFSGAGTNLQGSIWDVNINNTNAYAGHGPDVGNWVDLIGSDVILSTDIAKLTLYTGTA